MRVCPATVAKIPRMANAVMAKKCLILMVLGLLGSFLLLDFFPEEFLELV